MDGRERKGMPLFWLRLAAIVFGLVTLAEAGTAAYLAVRLHQELGPYGAVGFTIIAKPDALRILLPVLPALPPILTAAALVSLHRRERGNDGR